ncbi:MAG: hypothetical protein BWY78_00755 [Alphaproteobacteria bacterium ADurb.Bin438]|nr:MAG: hypothetical protein BWY78_00755 [Alphaproteobacteria bacterium ADurb.Bin438]
MKWPISKFVLKGVKGFDLMKQDLTASGTILEDAFEVTEEGDFGLEVEFQPDFVPPSKS